MLPSITNVINLADSHDRAAFAMVTHVKQEPRERENSESKEEVMFFMESKCISLLSKAECKNRFFFLSLVVYSMHCKLFARSPCYFFNMYAVQIKFVIHMELSKQLGLQADLYLLFLGLRFRNFADSSVLFECENFSIKFLVS